MKHDLKDKDWERLLKPERPQVKHVKWFVSYAGILAMLIAMGGATLIFVAYANYDENRVLAYQELEKAQQQLIEHENHRVHIEERIDRTKAALGEYRYEIRRLERRLHPACKDERLQDPRQ